MKISELFLLKRYYNQLGNPHLLVVYKSLLYKHFNSVCCPLKEWIENEKLGRKEQIKYSKTEVALRRH